MVLKQGREQIRFQTSVKTGVYTCQGKYGLINTTTSRTLNHTVSAYVHIEVDGKAIDGMVAQACRNKSKKCVDGPVTVKISDVTVISSVEVACRSCGKLNDYGVPCGDGTINQEVK